MAQRIPTQHTAGDSFSAVLWHPDHPASDGWAGSLLLIADGGRRQQLSSTASGDEHAVQAAASATATWAAAFYDVFVVYSKSATSARASYRQGRLQVLPDPASRATCPDSFKGPARRAYDDLQAAYRAYLAAGRWTIQEYMIAGRRMTFRALPELLRAIDNARREAEAEDAALALSAGVSPRQRLVVRM